MAKGITVPLYRRWIAGILAAMIGLGPLATPGYAALTLLSDQPLSVQNQSKPNIMLTVDDSTSMLYDFLPDTAIDNYCRDATGNMNAACGRLDTNFDFTSIGHGRYRSGGYVFEQFGFPFPAYDAAFDASGPGAGCKLFPVPTSTCSGGIDPGPLPGLERYPGPPGPTKSPDAGKPYEYWTLWPAPVHNTELNHAYYNPRLNYEPPVQADGTPYPQMNGPNTADWTHVPADPWATTVKYVDLTQLVTIGMWCNSDWSQGHENDPRHCRTNGVGPAATSSSAASADGDYSYPWAPPGVDPTTGSSTALSIAYAKVNATTHAALAAWSDTSPLFSATGPAKDPKYYYQNDNVIWCDTTSPLWPNYGPLIPQTCTDPAPVITPQACLGVTDQTCGGGTPQTCVGGGPQTCNGAVAQHCGSLAPQTCSAVPQTCNGYAPQTCEAIGHQTCDGIGPQTCNNIHVQTCDPVGEVCNLPDISACTIDYYIPLGCDTCTHECPATCDPHYSCPPGHCSLTGGNCAVATDCPGLNQCSFTHAACAGSCPTVPGNCSLTGESCLDAGICPNEGHCSLDSSLCDALHPCGTLPGHCSTVTTTTCFNDATCLDAGACSSTGVPCTSDLPFCPTLPGVCSVDGLPCTGTCGLAGACNLSGAVCHVDGECPAFGGTCSVDSSPCTTTCPDVAGHCSIQTTTACAVDATCLPVGSTCSVTHESCSGSYSPYCDLSYATCSEPAYCPRQGGTCSIDGSPCLHFFSPPTWDLTYCNPISTAGLCSIDHTTCWNDSMCPPKPSASGAAVCSDLVAGSTTATVVVPNGNFETPFVADVAAPGGSWVWGAGTAMLRFPSAYGAASSGDGAQGALIQGAGSFSQTIAMSPGSYRISFQAARRSYSVPAGTAQPILVSVDGVPLGSPVVPTPDFLFNTFVFGFGIATAGPHTITFSGTDGSGDKTSFIDLVQITSGKSLLEDADGPGLVCRHNNQAYGAVSANRFNYPNTQFNTAVTAGSGPNACNASPRYAFVPRHYYKTGVEWCDRFIATAGDKWHGYGTPVGGSCQDSADATHTFPRFYKFGQDPATDNYGTPAFQRIDLDITKKTTATYTHTWTDDSGDVQTVTRTFDGATPDVSEMTNYANWFAYYRTRIQAVKTTTSLSFNELDAKYRVGFHNLTKLTSFVNISDFTPAQKTTWFTQLFGVQIPLGQQTPSLEAVVRIGEYYKNGTHPQLAGSTDPIVLACQKNWHMFFTDGYTNQAALPTTVVGNLDDLVPALPDVVPGLTTGAPWPAPYREDPLGSVANSLSDYATYYWVTDLRTSGAESVNNVAVSSKDPASWQHQNFAAISLGTSGKLPAGSQAVTEAQLTAGTLQWPKPYPTVFRPDNSGVDDLWHASINGRGSFVNAQSADEVKLGIGQILAELASASGVRAGVGLQNVNFGASASFIYQVSFEPKWGGGLRKLQINPATGAFVAETWKAETQLDTQLQVIPHVIDTPWFTQRKIVTLNETGTAVPFLWGNLGGNQRDSLAPGKPAARGQAILEFLRGNRAKEGTKLNQLRSRNTALGDIADSEAAYVGVPNAPYRDGDDPGYFAFKTSFAARAATIYAGANDGMLHAFDDLTGNETWAFVPSALFRGGTAGGDVKTGLGALAYQDGALPPFRHHYYVDGAVKVVDVNVAAHTAGVDWRTVLVGGLGKGGNVYYALDVTDPAAITSEAAAATKVMWEFKPPDMGYTYGKPIIVKTHGFSGAWVAILATGYNNPSGLGKLYFVRISDGTLLKTMSTGVGSAGTPSGLAHASAYTKDYHNQLAEQIYAGDLLGNFWRFDLSNADPALWTVGRLATLTDGGGIAQPVTSPPQIEIDVDNRIDRWVFVGTGKLYDDSDLSSTQIQTMYAIRDGTQDAPWALPFPAVTRGTTPATDLLALVHDVGHKFGLDNKPDKGWFDDLPAGQQIVAAPQAAVSIIGYIGSSVQTDPCLTGMQANVYAREFSTGQSLFTDSGGVPIESVAVPEGGVGLAIVALETAAGAAPEIRLVVTTAAKISPKILKPGKSGALADHRMSWRLLGQ